MIFVEAANRLAAFVMNLREGLINVLEEAVEGLRGP
jgi:hypothetical protein